MTDSIAQSELSRLAALVQQVAYDRPYDGEISERTRFVEDIGLESVNRLMLMTLVEQEFGVSLEKHMAALVELRTVGETVGFIKSLKAG